MSRIRFAYFDAAGTLISPAPSVGAVYAAAGRPHGLRASPEALEAAFRAVRGEIAPGSGPELAGRDDESTRGVWRAIVFRVFDRVGFEGERERCFDALYRAFEAPTAWRIFDDVEPSLAALGARGIGLGVLSNWDHRLPALLARLGLDRRFETVVVSALERAAKPDLALFELAVRRAGVPPEAVLYAGDRRDLDLLPALAAGIDAYLIDRSGPPSEDPRVIASLGRLVDRA